jgi:hypothetical protein
MKLSAELTPKSAGYCFIGTAEGNLMLYALRKVGNEDVRTLLLFLTHTDDRA